MSGELVPHIPLTLARHPLEMARETLLLPAGGTIAEILLAAGLPPQAVAEGTYHVRLRGGHDIPPAVWHRVRPKAGYLIEVRALPAGSGFGNIARIVLQIGLVLVGAYLGGIYGASLGAALGTSAAVGTAIITTGVSLIGSLALNALIPPATPRFRDTVNEATSPTLSITGSRNQANPNGPIPKIYGRHRIYPPYAAQPYTEVVGNDQYLNLLFCAGYGPLELSDFRIGETPISQYDGVEMEVRQGYAGDAPLNLFRNSVDVIGYSDKLTAGNPVVRETAPDADEISVDLTFNGLVSFDSESGARLNRSVDVRCEYRAVGAGAWIPAPTATESPTLRKYVEDRNWQNSLERVSAPLGEKYSVYRTIYPVNGGIRLGLTCPVSQTHSLGTTAYYGAQYRILARVVGATNWTLLIDMGTVTTSVKGSTVTRQEYLSPGVERIFDLQPPALGRKIEIRIECKSIQRSGLSPEPPGNEENYRIVPDPSLIAYERILDNNGVSRFTDRTEQAVRRVVRIRPEARGKFEVRLTRITDDSNATNVRDELYLSAIQSIQYAQPVNQPKPLALVALRIKATDQLNGIIDTFNCVAESILPRWNGSAWVAKTTRNPAAAFLDVLRGAGNSRAVADSQIDWPALQAWAAFCDALPPQPVIALPDGVTSDVTEPYMTFDAVIDFRTSVQNLLRDIAAAGRATLNRVGNMWSVVHDRLQTTPVQVFTPVNTRSFNGDLSLEALPDAFKVRFINEDTNWQQDEITVYRDGYDDSNASTFESLEQFGVTRSSQAWRNARYMLAVGEHRREVFSFETDVEYIVCTKGDLVRFQHDVPSIGLSAARVKARTLNGSGDVTHITLDLPVEMATGTSYGVQIRVQSGAVVNRQVVTVNGEQATLQLSSVIPAATAPQAGDLVVFGILGQETLDLLVREIQPTANLSARLVCVPLSPVVYDADTRSIPDYIPLITVDPVEAVPAAPTNVRLLERSVVTYQNADPVIEVRVTWDMPTGYAVDYFEVYRDRGEGNDYRLQGTTKSRDLLLAGQYFVGETVDVRVVAVGLRGQRLPISQVPSAQLTIRQNLLLVPPADVPDFRISVNGATAFLSWAPVRNSDLAYYVLRHQAETIPDNISWGSAIPLVSRIARDASTLTVPALNGAYLIKAVDTSGRESVNPAVIITNAAGVLATNTVATISESPTFSGGKTQVYVNDGDSLTLAPSNQVDEWIDVDEIVDWDTGIGGIYTEGTYTFANGVDLGDVYDVRLIPTLRASGFTIGASVDEWLSVDAVENWDGDEPGQWSVVLEYRKTNDNPAGTPAWTEWMPLSISDDRARAFQFRIQLASLGDGVMPAVSELSVKIDMPDRVVAGSDLVCSAAGITVTFNPPFRNNDPAIGISAQGLSTGDYYQITAKSATGFTIRFFNAAGTGVERTFDYVAKGYGYRRT